MSNRNPAVTVIIPTYNSSGTLRLALQSVLLQDFTDYEIWVVGDGCTDDSEKALTSFEDSRIHWINLPTNSGGPSVPRNEGIRQAKGQFIAYLGHDDLWFPWHLSESINCIKTKNADFVYSLGASLGPDGIIETFTIPEQPWSPGENISPSSWLHKKSITRVVGAWPTSKEPRYDDDRQFLLRVQEERMKVVFQKRLSVLRFPSGKWRMYSLKRNFPQARYLSAMSENPLTLCNETLELAAVKREHEGGDPISRSLRSVLSHAIFVYGCDRWPMNKLLRWRRRRKAGLQTIQ